MKKAKCGRMRKTDNPKTARNEMEPSSSTGTSKSGSKDSKSGSKETSSSKASSSNRSPDIANKMASKLFSCRKGASQLLASARMFRSFSTRSRMSVTTQESEPKNTAASEKYADPETKKDYEEAAKSLLKEKWYHGLMPRDDIEELIKNPGDFIVRKTEVSRKPRYVLSAVSAKKTKIHHIVIILKQHHWCIREQSKKTVSEIIKEHEKKKLPIHTDGTVLLKGITRPDYYILHDHIEVEKRIGGGAFGDVFVGSWKKADGVIKVAVKRLKGQITKKERVIFLKEAKLMKRLDHKNIVRLHGIAPQIEPLMIVLEFAANGCLKNHLKDHPDVEKSTLTKFVTDAARGLYYLSSCKVIHRDVAARNCLLGPEFEVKISDFGLSEADTSVLKLQKLKNMPIKWLSPETLRQGIFSTKTDVWSFGVLIWEVFNRCKTDPFPGKSNAQAKEQILSGKQPMRAPDSAPIFISNIMQICFTQVPEDRADFVRIMKMLAPDENQPPITFFNGHPLMDLDDGYP